MTYSRVARLKAEQQTKLQKQRYSIRKVSAIGATSALIGTLSFASANVQADEATSADASTALVSKAPSAVSTESDSQPAEATKVTTTAEAVTATPEASSDTGTTTEEPQSTSSETTTAGQDTDKVSAATSENQAATETTQPVEDNSSVTTDSATVAKATDESDGSGSVASTKSSTITTAASQSDAAKSNSTVDTGSLDAELVLSRLNDKVRGVVSSGLSTDEILKLTDEQIDTLNKIDFTDNRVVGTGTSLTYKNLKDIVATFLKQDSRYAIPYFKADTIVNMPAMNTVDAQTMEKEELDIWDSWPVQDAVTGVVSNWNGYQLVVAMAGAANKNSNHIYFLYNEYGNNDFANWRNAGPIFGYNAIADEQQWSGSATVNSDGSIQLFYTKNDTSEGKLNWQRLATATLNLAVENGQVVIKSVDNDHQLFAGDGYHYQNYQQFSATYNDDLNHDGDADRTDNYTLRDPHVIEVDGSRYLVFEANTGTENYQGENQIYTWANYGGDDHFNISSLLNVTGNKDLHKLASWANGAIGILKLDDNEKNPSVSQVYTPLMTSHMVTDEVERPSVVKLGDKYYLFTASRINKSSDAEGTVAARKAVGDDVVMLGFVSDSLMGSYKRLNGSGVVLTASVPADWRTSTYSYYAVPVEGSTNKVLITAYMTNRGGIAGAENKSTWAPSFLVQINDDGTTEVLPYMTNQGDWIWDDSSNTLKHVGDNNNSRLPNEDYTVDWYTVGNYGLPPHHYNNTTVPVTPTEPSTPDVPTTPTTPNTPDVPTTPTTPNTPDVPTTPTTPNTPGVSTTPSTPTRGGGHINPGIPVDAPVVSAATLPATGDSQSAAAILGFAILSSMATYVAYSGYKRKYNR
ncbi:Levansucrase [Streptococcus infantarius subsp. infantarius]|nr:Levansucrase [Streptococcus infantarius subsp. infantarius]MCO4478458.1 Levansucrase [Streptococcus infantarius subsp. infantarius]